SLLPQLFEPDGPLGRGSARPGVAFALRRAGARAGGEYPPPAEPLWPAVGGSMPCLARNQALGPHRERGTGAPAAVRLRRRLLEAFRIGARTAAVGPRRLPGAIRGPG